jgi:NADH-ubiquinone oxidoreductase chain 5
MTTAGIAATLETDFKKIIALSTLSQLGLIIASIAMGIPLIAFFHLVTHATFKALIFICAGAMISLSHHTQDLRQIRGVSTQLPLTTSSLLLANFALCGLPFLSGFYSKDLLLEVSLFNPLNPFILLLLITATGLTAAYSTQIVITI